MAKTKKGYGLGGAGESRMIAHQAKKLDTEVLFQFRDRIGLPMSDENIENVHLFAPDPHSKEMEHLRERREALGGYMPKQERKAPALSVSNVPELST